MKGFLDKTWAKAAAFVLTLVFGVLTVLGGVGVGILISYDVFLDGGDFMRQTMYEGSCVRSIDTADSFLRGTLANAGVLVSDGTYDYDTVENGDITEEEQAQVISDLPRVFAEEFSRDAADCHLTVTVRGNGEVVGTFENFELTDGDKPLYTTQETFTYALNTGNTAMVTIAADLLRSENAPSYSYLLCQWLLEHTGLTIFLTALFALLALFFFCFLMASAGHWAGHEGIHLTWLDKIPADVWLIVLLCTFFIGWEAFYYGWGRVFFCAALVPLVLLFLCAFAAQCKAGTVLRSALIARIARFLWRIVRSLFLGLWRIAKSLPLIWKTALAGLVLAFVEFFLFEQSRSASESTVIFLLLKLVELLAILYIALNLRMLQKGGEKLAFAVLGANGLSTLILWWLAIHQTQSYAPDAQTAALAQLGQLAAFAARWLPLGTAWLLVLAGTLFCISLVRSALQAVHYTVWRTDTQLGSRGGWLSRFEFRVRSSEISYADVRVSPIARLMKRWPVFVVAGSCRPELPLFVYRSGQEELFRELLPEFRMPPDTRHDLTHRSAVFFAPAGIPFGLCLLLVLVSRSVLPALTGTLLIPTAVFAVFLAGGLMGWLKEGIWLREGRFTLRRQKGVYLHCICVFHPDVCLRTFQTPWAARYQRMTLTLALPGQVRLKVRSIPVRDAAPCLNALEQET